MLATKCLKVVLRFRMHRPYSTQCTDLYKVHSAQLSGNSFAWSSAYRA